jgi:hypothetical protein
MNFKWEQKNAKIWFLGIDDFYWFLNAENKIEIKSWNYYYIIHILSTYLNYPKIIKIKITPQNKS